MKPAFALSLSQDGIILLHRKGSAWEIVGEVDPEAPGLDAAMADLRTRAAALEPGGFTSKLVLPKSQLLFTEARAPGPDTATRRSEIARALEGRTPYPVADLVFDWSGNGKTVKVAVVAKVTLEEAENFASHYGFNPVSFVGDPDGASFAGEPWFGLAAGAGRHVKDDDKVARDQDPVGLAHLVHPNMPASEPEAEVHALIPARAPDDVEAAFVAIDEDDDTDATALRIVVQEPEDPVEQGSVTSAMLPEPAPEASVTRGEVPALDSEDWLAPAAEEIAAEDDGTTAATAAEPPAFATIRAAPTATEGVTKHLAGRATRIDIVAPLSGGPKLGGAIAAQGAELPAAAQTGPMQPARPLRADAKAKSSSKALRRVLARAVGSKAPKPQLRHPRRSPEVEANELTVFGARRQSRQRPRSSRLVGIFLTLALVFVMAAAVLWSMLFDRTAVDTASNTTTGAAPALSTTVTQVPGPSNGTTTANDALPAPSDDTASGTSSADAGQADAGSGLDVVVPDPNADVSPPADDPSQADPITATPDAGVTGDGVAADGAGTAAATDATGTGDAAAEAAAAAAAASLAATAASSAAADATTTATTQGAAATAPSDPATVAAPTAVPDQATAPDAAATPAPTASAPQATSQPVIADAPASGTSVWGVAPDKSNAPSSEDTGLVVPGMNEAAKTGSAGRLPDEQALLHDPDPATLPQPVPFDKLLRYDQQGLIIPTPEGVVSPDGFTVFAGKPPVVSKPRPPGLKAIPEAVEIPLGPVDPAAPRLPNPLSTKRPVLRPDDLVITVPQQGQNAIPALPESAPIQTAVSVTPSAPADATPTIAQPFASDPKLASFRQKDRPASVLAGAAAPAVEPPAPPADPRLAALKPKNRPAQILAAAKADSEARALIADAAKAAAGAESQTKPVTASATRLAVATSLRPTERPSRLSQGVSAAVALAVATSVADAAPAPEQMQAAALDNTQVTVRGSAAVPEEAAVEKAQSATPNLPSRASVAKEATIANVMDLGRVNLIGIYGSQSDRRAMVRLPTGRYVKVKVGDVLDGGRVAAIGDTQLSYVKSGRTIVLKMIRDS